MSKPDYDSDEWICSAVWVSSSDQKHLCQLQYGDTFIMEVDWYDGRMLNVFRVTEPVADYEQETWEQGDTPVGSVGAKGRDGHIYRIYVDNPHVECVTDGKRGRDRGTKSSGCYLINDKLSD